MSNGDTEAPPQAHAKTAKGRLPNGAHLAVFRSLMCATKSACSQHIIV